MILMSTLLEQVCLSHCIHLSFRSLTPPPPPPHTHTCSLVFAACGVVATALAQIFTNTYQKSLDCNALQLLYHTAPLIAVGMLIMCPFFDDIGALMKYEYSAGCIFRICEKSLGISDLTSCRLLSCQASRVSSLLESTSRTMSSLERLLPSLIKSVVLLPPLPLRPLSTVLLSLFSLGSWTSENNFDPHPWLHSLQCQSLSSSPSLPSSSLSFQKTLDPRNVVGIVIAMFGSVPLVSALSSSSPSLLFPVLSLTPKLEDVRVLLPPPSLPLRRTRLSVKRGGLFKLHSEIASLGSSG
jgi:hypothetical protein